LDFLEEQRGSTTNNLSILIMTIFNIISTLVDFTYLVELMTNLGQNNNIKKLNKFVEN
jgi:hypothetical protein